MYRVLVKNVTPGMSELGLQRELTEAVNHNQEELGDDWVLLGISSTVAKCTFLMTFMRVR